MKIICIGRNYSDHANEMNAAVPEEPMFFMKPDVALLKPGESFYYPEFSKDIHYECELVIKISRQGKHIAKEFANRYYESVGLGIDFTARDLQQKCKEKGHPWEIAKSFEGSAAISSSFIPVNELNIESIPFRLFQNENCVQNGNSSEMIISFDELIAYVSRFMTLKTGDLIYTGTPAGVGPVKIGDQLKGFIQELEMFHFEIK